LLSVMTAKPQRISKALSPALARQKLPAIQSCGFRCWGKGGKGGEGCHALPNTPALPIAWPFLFFFCGRQPPQRCGRATPAREQKIERSTVAIQCAPFQISV
jgi:hypothetical protein